MDELTISGVALSGIILVLVQFAKSTGMGNRWIPLLTLVLGVPFAVLYSISKQPATLENVLVAGVQGIMSAAAAMGFWSGFKNALGR